MDFLKTSDFSPNELEEFIHSAIRFKNGRSSKALAGKSIALVFFDPSLRTRASMQVAIHELGGNPVLLDPGSSSWNIEHRENAIMDGNKTEHVAEFVRVLERYVSAIGVRTFAKMKDWDSERQDPILAAFRRYAKKPLINLESAMHHPCQAMADMLTIREKLGEGPKKVLLTWAWHPKPLPMAVPNSFALAAAQFGHDLRIAHPPGYGLDEKLIGEIKSLGFNLEVINDTGQAFEGVDAVYAKSWGSKDYYGDPEGDIVARAAFRDKWMVDAPKMKKSNDAIFMHCLPVRRNVVVSDEVIDSKNSVVIDQAENRLHVQKAILAKLLG